MVPAFDPLLVLSAKLTKVDSILIDLAFQFAIYSQIDVAQSLVSLLNKYQGLYHQTSVHLQPLWLCWQSVNSWPDGEREKAGTDEEIEELAKAWREGWWYPEDPVNGPNGSGSDFEQLERTMQQLDDLKFPSLENGYAGWKVGALVKVLDLRLGIQEGEPKESCIPHVNEILQRVVQEISIPRGSGNGDIVYNLAQSRRVWELVKMRGIANAVGVDESELTKLGKFVVDTFYQRFEQGRQRSEIPGALEDIIVAISTNTRHNPNAKQQLLENGELEEETDEIPCLLQDPASESSITALEERLGTQLPAEYKEFLRLSNGLGASWNGVCFDPPLFSAEEVKWIDDEGEEDFMANIPLDLLELGVHFFIDKLEDWPKVGRVLYVGIEDITCLWLLPPITVAKTRDAYLALLENNDSSDVLKMEIASRINDFCGTVEKFKELEWCVAEWDSMNLVGWKSFDEFMVDKVRVSA